MQKNFFSDLKDRSAPINGILEFLSPKGRILDIGCGTGNGCRLIKNNYPESSVLGVDISDVRILQAKLKSLNYGIKFVCTDIKNLKEINFDNAVISHVLYLIPKDKQYELLEECNRVLKNGAVLSIVALDPEKFVNRLKIVGTFYILKTIGKFLNILPICKENVMGIRSDKPYYQTKDQYIKILNNLKFELFNSKEKINFLYNYFELHFKKL